MNKGTLSIFQIITQSKELNFTDLCYNQIIQGKN